MNPLRVALVSGLGAYNDAKPNEAAEYAPPLGVLTLAALLRGTFQVSVIDLDYLWGQSVYDRPRFQSMAIEAICITEPTVIGLSTICGSYPLTLRLAEECSHRMPSATIVLGGPQATATDVETITAFPFIDMILRGEADESFPALVSAIADNRQVNGIPGLTYRDQSRICRNTNAAAILDLDRLPLPAYDLIPRIDDLGAFPLEIGRGCPYTCTFCSTNDFFRRRFRLKSATHVLDEMHRLHETWGVTTFDLVHDMFTVDRRRVVEFCETMIQAASPYKWSCSARTDSVDADLLRLMRRAGCHDIFFGIETGSQRMQRIIDKDLDLIQAREILRENTSLGIHTTASLIVGYPQETMADLRDTLAFFADVMLMPLVDPQLNILAPLSGTPITTEYRDRLTLDENWTTISENGTLQDAVDRLMIAAHPDIFANFYAFPFFTSRDLLRRLRDFLFFGVARCGGLMRALYLHTNDIFGAFESWEKTCPNFATAWFASLDFVHHLIAFCEASYPESPSIVATARFCRSAYSQITRSPRAAFRSEPFLDLSDECVLIECDCDINAVLEALARGEQPDPAAFASPVTVGVKLTSLNRVSIVHLPPITLDLLRHAEKASTLAAIESEFEERDISVSGLPSWKVVAGGIDYLEKLKLARRVFPDNASLPPEGQPLTATA